MACKLVLVEAEAGDQYDQWRFISPHRDRLGAEGPSAMPSAGKGGIVPGPCFMKIAEVFRHQRRVMGETRTGWDPEDDGKLIRADLEGSINDAFAELVGKTIEACI
jgi:hypothetical protein